MFAKKLIQALGQELGIYFDGTLNLPIQSLRDASVVQRVQSQDISAFIELEGFVEATIGLSVSNELAQMMARNFIFDGADDEIVAQYASQSVAESLNVVVGLTLPRLEKISHQAKIEFSTPKVFEKAVLVEARDEDLLVQSQFNYQGETIQLIYLQRGEDGKSISSR